MDAKLYLREKRHEYLVRLKSDCVKVLLRVFQQLYVETKTSCVHPRLILREFQQRLKAYAQEPCHSLQEQLENVSPHLTSLVTSIFKTYYLSNGWKHVNLPSVDDYVNETRLAIARSIYKNPFPFYDVGVSSKTKKDNLLALEAQIEKIIEETFVKMLPLASFDMLDMKPDEPYKNFQENMDRLFEQESEEDENEVEEEEEEGEVEEPSSHLWNEEEDHAEDDAENDAEDDEEDDTEDGTENNDEDDSTITYDEEEESSLENHEKKETPDPTEPIRKTSDPTNISSEEHIHEDITRKQLDDDDLTSSELVQEDTTATGLADDDTASEKHVYEDTAIKGLDNDNASRHIAFENDNHDTDNMTNENTRISTASDALANEDTDMAQPTTHHVETEEDLPLHSLSSALPDLDVTTLATPKKFVIRRRTLSSSSESSEDEPSDKEEVPPPPAHIPDANVKVVNIQETARRPKHRDGLDYEAKKKLVKQRMLEVMKRKSGDSFF